MKEVTSVIEKNRDFGKFFPYGINKIRLEVKVASSEINLEIAGPDRASAQSLIGDFFEQKDFGSARWRPAWRTLKRPSGASWVSDFPASTSTSDLLASFRPGVDAFISAMRAAGATVSISNTLRPPERAYLMHYSWRVAKKIIKAKDVPAMDGVDIEWVHATDAASIQAAQDMVAGYEIVAAPALTSRHTEGRAIDMTISWTSNLTIAKKDGTTQKITTTPRTGENADLISVGSGYGVIKATFTGDPPHWSDDGN